MKKVFVALFICLLVLASVCSNGQIAQASETGSSTHLVKPTAIAVVDHYLFVADNIQSNKTIILIFDVSNDAPRYLSSYQMEGDVKRLVCAKSNLVFAVCNDKTQTLNVSKLANGQLEITQGESYAKDGYSFVDFAIAPDSAETLPVALMKNEQEGKFFVCNSKSGKILTFTPLPFSADETPLSLLFLDNYFYYLFNKNGNADCNRLNSDCSNEADGDNFNKFALLGNYSPKGLFTYTVSTTTEQVTVSENKLGFFEDSNVYCISQNLGSNTEPALLKSNFENKIIDVQSYNERLYVLNNANKIDVYHKSGDNKYEKSTNATIGSEQVNVDLPTQFTSFYLAQSNGYPTNIVYKTKGNDSVDNLLTPFTNRYVLLGYDGDSASDYYFVMLYDVATDDLPFTCGKFGWVKKSDNVKGLPLSEAVRNDDNLTIVSTLANGLDSEQGDVDVKYTAKFVSLDAVHVKQLPFASASVVDTLQQTATTMTPVNVLQRFVEPQLGTVWYYVSYKNGNETKHGFVESGKLGKFRTVATHQEIEVQDEMKINSSLFDAVTLYLSSNVTDNEKVVDKNGKDVKLYSGDRVAVIKTENGMSYVQLLHDDGTYDIGWVSSDCLTEVHSLTNNVIVGLVFLGVAIVLVALLFGVLAKRKKDLQQ